MLLQPAASCAAASYAAAGGRGVAAAALRLTVHRCCRRYSYASWYAVVLFLLLCLVCRVTARPHIPPQFRRRRLQDFVYLYKFPLTRQGDARVAAKLGWIISVVWWQEGGVVHGVELIKYVQVVGVCRRRR